MEWSFKMFYVSKRDLERGKGKMKSNDYDKSVGEAAIELLGSLGVFSLAVFNMFFGAFVSMWLLNWFVADVVLYQFSYWNSFGLFLMVAYMSRNHNFDFDDKSNKDKAKELGYKAAQSSLVLFIGWLVS